VAWWLWATDGRRQAWRRGAAVRLNGSADVCGAGGRARLDDRKGRQDGGDEAADG